MGHDRRLRAQLVHRQPEIHPRPRRADRLGRFRAGPGQVGRHPLLTLIEGVRYTGEEAKIPRRVYIFASDWQPTRSRASATRCQAEGGWDYHDSKASHFVMADQPEQLLEIMLGLAS